MRELACAISLILNYMLVGTAMKVSIADTMLVVSVFSAGLHTVFDVHSKSEQGVGVDTGQDYFRQI